MEAWRDGRELEPLLCVINKEQDRLDPSTHETIAKVTQRIASRLVTNRVPSPKDES